LSNNNLHKKNKIKKPFLYIHQTTFANIQKTHRTLPPISQATKVLNKKTNNYKQIIVMKKNCFQFVLLIGSRSTQQSFTKQIAKA
jgi:hypothetical protein